ncbi:cytoskeleton protein RodZ [Vibrio sp. LaRot3]|uniref:cytoskeleton protein RodZ n=1 Tax=Vibrio sp. LaRot3 TaxID=2998829 RepID=UPI0022CDCAF1|nr:cytoskeleton protein RodZ [Vibrio sp. LaRot3]MDA0149136.1 cytoskeleton protein RodZ [Vibrio sp. LaRot3]
MNSEQTAPVNEDNVDSIRLEAGTILKNKREELGLSQKQIADRLRLRISIIENIEDNQFESDQVATFTRGYLRSYAKAVGIDEEVVFSALDDCGSAQQQEQKMQSFSRQTNREKHDSRIMLITWGIVAVIVGISSVWWWQNQQKDVVDLVAQEELIDSTPDAQLETIAAEQPALDVAPLETIEAESEPQQPVVEENASNDEAQVEAPQASTQQASQDDAATKAAKTESAPEAQAAEPVTPSEPQTEPVALNSLVINFNGDCWIQVKDATGKTLVSRVKNAGEELKLEGKKPYKVILGAPENVSITLASEPVDLSGYTAGKVARFTLP